MLRLFAIIRTLLNFFSSYTELKMQVPTNASYALSQIRIQCSDANQQRISYLFVTPEAASLDSQLWQLWHQLEKYALTEVTPLLCFPYLSSMSLLPVRINLLLGAVAFSPNFQPSQATDNAMDGRQGSSTSCYGGTNMPDACPYTSVLPFASSMTGCDVHIPNYPLLRDRGGRIDLSVTKKHCRSYC